MADCCSCDNAALAFQEYCDDINCPKCNRPHFPHNGQPTWYIPDNPDEPIGQDTPQRPIQPNLPDFPLQPQYPEMPINPTQIPIEPYSPQYPILPIGQKPTGPPPQQPIQIIPPPPPPKKIKQPIHILPPPPPNPINPFQGVNWLLFGTQSPDLTNYFISQGTGASAAALFAVLGADTPLLAGPWAPIGIVVLVATSIAFAVMSILDQFAGRPKMQDTADISRFANSPSPILSALGKAAARGLALGIPFSESNSAVWASIYGNAVQAAYADLQALYPQYTARQLNVLFYILLSEMGHPENHSPIFIIQMLRDELKDGQIKPPAAATAQARTASPGKMRIPLSRAHRQRN